MIDTNDYYEEKSCIYKGEEYLVRDNGAVLRKAPPQKKPRKLDNTWTFGKLNPRTGYLEIASVRIHRIVATAFHGEPPTPEHVVDHIDTNRQNNRPSNLRWLTRLENVVLNPVTRKKIEYRTGVSIEMFLSNPAAYRDAFDDQDYSWMRRVTAEEAQVCLENMKKWGKRTTPSPYRSNTNLGDWIFNVRDPEYQQQQVEKHIHFQEPQNESADILDSLTPMAKQKDWRIPSNFPCCPEQVNDDPIECYAKNLSDNAVFAVNQYGKSTIVKYATVDDNSAIIIITQISPATKPFALAKITYENCFYLHSSLGTFFTFDGADKRFTLAQGLEWTGGDSIDDYC